jgi:predicted transcriptional regulator
MRIIFLLFDDLTSIHNVLDSLYQKNQDKKMPIFFISLLQSPPNKLNNLNYGSNRIMTMHLEDFGSVGILKVLRVVTEHGPLNISHLTRKTDMNHGSVDYCVKKLANMGLVTENRYGKIRMIKPAFDSFTIRFKKGMDIKIFQT